MLSRNLYCFVENKYFDGFYLAENQHLINGCVEFGFALFFGMLIEVSYLWDVKMNELTLKNK